MDDRIYDPGQFTARVHERDDCVHYLKCLGDAAKGPQRRGRHGSGGDSCLPCRDCKRFEVAEPELASAWAQPWGYEPWGRW